MDHHPLVSAWIRDLALTHATTTRARYSRILNCLIRDLPEGVSLANCTDREIRTYLAMRAEAGISARTQRQTLSAMRCWSLWAMREGLRMDDPTRLITWPKLPKTRMRPLSAAQLRQLLKLLRDGPPSRRGVSNWQWERNRRALLLMLYAGLRLSEVGALLWEQIDLEARLLYVEDGKGAKDRTLPIHRELLAALYAVPAQERVGSVAGSRKGKPMGPKTMAHICQRWLPSMGIEDVTAHSLRRTCATLMRRNGSDLEAIRGMLGHESLATTEIYLGPDPELLRRGVDQLPDIDALLEAPPDIRALPKRRATGD
ncbi:tyrosine-type recombinase/integrase [Chloroflexales bacterium ZM16-3]|nr:tyrosine-type recombinase/integrase [Chloroflexales bacterium ZM16-3]